MKVEKRLYKINASKYILIPSEFLKLLDIKENVILNLDFENSRIIIEKSEEVK